MPSYDFICSECGASWEARMSMSAYSAGEGRHCPECGSTRAERAFTAVNVILGGRSGAGQGSGGSSGGGCYSGSGFT